MRPAVAIVRRIAVRPGPVLRDLLAIARDHEQAVVDREAEAEAGDEVEREDRDRADLGRAAQHHERADDRQAADEQRQQSRDEAAEEQQREQEEDREGVELRGAQVALGLLVDLLLGERGAADGDAGLVVELLGDALGRLLVAVVVARAQRDREVGGVAVARDEGVRLGGQVAVTVGDVVVGLEVGGDRLHALGAVGALDVDAVDEHDDLGRAISGVLEALLGDDALGVGVVGAVGVEAVGDAGAEHAGEGEEDGGDDEHALGAPVGEAGETIDHEPRGLLLTPVGDEVVERDSEAKRGHRPPSGIRCLRALLDAAKPCCDLAVVVALGLQRSAHAAVAGGSRKEDFEHALVAHLLDLGRLAEPFLQVAPALGGELELDAPASRARVRPRP